MATLSSNTVPLPSTTNNYELDYSPPNSNTSTLKQRFNQTVQINNNNNNNNKFNIASATDVNPSMNFTYASPQAVNTTNSNDSGFDNTTFGTPNSFANNSTGNVNSIANNFTNLSFTNSKELNQNIINNFGQNNNIGFSASGLSSAQHAAGIENKCLRCGNQVYALERIGPIKGNIYHKTCFKCLVCDRQLDLKTYYTNQVDLNERQIYCQSHAPKSGKGVFGADNIYIHNILNAPKLDVMQKVDNKPKVIVLKKKTQFYGLSLCILPFFLFRFFLKGEGSLYNCLKLIKSFEAEAIIISKVYITKHILKNNMKNKQW